MRNELTQQPIAIANSSGFPLQIATVHAVNQSSNWRVVLEEHPWRSDMTGSEGFIDIVAVTRHDDGFSAMVLECKRVRQTAWVFLIPDLSPSPCRRTTAWESHRVDSKWKEYRWVDWRTYPSTYESQDCAIPGQEQGRKTLLERTASELINSVEVLAAEEKQIQEKGGTNNFTRLYIPVVVTTAQLFVSHFDPATISLADGSLSKDTPVSQVPCIRFRKSLSTRAQSSSASSIEKLHTESERTIFVVHAEALPEFLQEFRVEG
jgi:hypothetical protein